MGVRCPPNRQRTEGPSEQTAGFGQRRRPAGRGSHRAHDPAVEERDEGVTPYYDADGVRRMVEAERQGARQEALL